MRTICYEMAVDFLWIFSVQHGEAPKVRTVANLFAEICYNNKDRLQAGIIVAGWDKHFGGQVFSVPLGGSLHKQPFAIGGMRACIHYLYVPHVKLGSGSTYIYGWCDAEYREGMSKDQCLTFVSKGTAWSRYLANISSCRLFSFVTCYGPRRFVWRCHSYGSDYGRGCGANLYPGRQAAPTFLRIVTWKVNFFCHGSHLVSPTSSYTI